MLRRHTGMSFPPGYLVYGLDTHHRLWCDSINRQLPTFRPLSTLLQSAVRSASLSLIGRTIRESQGLYSDGWAGRRLRYMLPPGNGPLVLRGELPDWEPLRGQKLRIRANGQLVGEVQVPIGVFQLAVELPATCKNTLLALELIAARWIRSLGDGRRLAYKFQSISI